MKHGKPCTKSILGMFLNRAKDVSEAKTNGVLLVFQNQLYAHKSEISMNLILSSTTYLAPKAKRETRLIHLPQHKHRYVSTMTAQEVELPTPTSPTREPNKTETGMEYLASGSADFSTA